MFKIKLLILLLISAFFLSCTKNNLNQNNKKYSISYISGEFDGLILKNILINNLSTFGLYDEKSNFTLEPVISHSSLLFITNIDNTSDRMRMNSLLKINVFDQTNNCKLHEFEESISQFYLFADSDRYISNTKAEKKIKEENTEALVRKYINELIASDAKCEKNE